MLSDGGEMESSPRTQDVWCAVSMKLWVSSWVWRGHPAIAFYFLVLQSFNPDIRIKTLVVGVPLSEDGESIHQNEALIFLP